MKYLHYFDDDASFKGQYNGNGYKEPWVSLTEENDEVNYNKKKYEPLTFNILSDGEIGWKIGSGTTERTIQYSKNGGEWIDITSTTGGTTIAVVAGDVLRFKGDTWPASGSSNYSQFTSTCTFAASGNPGSLKYGEVTYGDEPLTSGCYISMFKDCTSLTSAPELPATTLARNCYYRMFYGCTGMTSAPELPATTLAYQCYQSMFCYCTSLASAPALPATTLAEYCYSGMFYGCTGMTSAPELPATTLETNCYSSMFQGCTSLTTAPELPATTLTQYCYSGMFFGCSNLNYVRCLATDISASYALSNWLNSVSSTGTFYKTAGVTYPSGASGIPAGWTIVDV